MKHVAREGEQFLSPQLCTSAADVACPMLSPSEKPASNLSNSGRPAPGGHSAVQANGAIVTCRSSDSTVAGHQPGAVLRAVTEQAQA